ncbi:MAG TPA: LPXTG cell wall anchor domain-containing protein, partial [Candidatus Saccharimonadales bacterium]|nr:LPXTG cell wall anchor domain-containing protein [Candidatus Saccharimonadales bacterium]
LYDSNGSVIKNLSDGITTAGVNVGDIAGSTTRFVNFKAKVACPPVQPPKHEFACKALDVNKVSRTQFDFTAHASVSNVTVQSYVFTAKDADGNVVDTETVTTSALSASYSFKQDKPGKYTISVVVKTDKGDAPVGTCTQQVTVEEEKTPPTPPVVEGKTTELPNTGAGAVVGLFAGVSALAGAGHFAFRKYFN